MLSPHRIQPNTINKRKKRGSNTNIDNHSQCERDLKGPQMTSNDLKMTSNEPVKNNRNNIKLGDPSHSQNDGRILKEQAFSTN